VTVTRALDEQVAAVTSLGVHSVEVPDTPDLLALLPAEECMSWVRDGEGLVGWGVGARLKVRGPQRFARAEQWWQELVARATVHADPGLPDSGLVAFGSFAFADTSAVDSTLVVPEVLVGRRDGRAWMTWIGTEPAPPVLTATDPRAPQDIRYEDGSLSAAEWRAAITEALDHISAGTLQKVVLAVDLEARATGPVDLRWLLRRLGEHYPTTWTFAVDGLVGATPELLIRVADGAVTSRVLAGTAGRTGAADEDAAAGEALWASAKENAEHEYAVRSLADALRPWCRSLSVPETPYVLELPNLMHLATDVTGTLAAPTSSLALAAALHPTAAVCGTPAAEAAQLIGELEQMDRGRYAGPVGWLDARGDGEWGIALRCAQQDSADPSRLRLFAGCGIVAGSEPDAEVAEARAKLVPLRDALSAP
jgi:menaquinone-specific isochorismate synthase